MRVRYLYSCSSSSAAEEVGGQRALGGGVRATACVRNETLSRVELSAVNHGAMKMKKTTITHVKQRGETQVHKICCTLQLTVKGRHAPEATIGGPLAAGLVIVRLMA